MTCNDSYQYPMKNKDVSTINDSVFYESDEYVDIISDSNKHVGPRNNPIAYTHIVDRFRNFSVGVGLFEPAIVIGGRISPITNILENLRVEIHLDSLSPLSTNQSKVFVIGSECKSVGVTGTSYIARCMILETFGGITLG